MTDTTKNHLRASDVQLPSTREEGAAALQVVKTAIANIQNQLQVEDKQSARVALAKWKEREVEILYALMLLGRGEDPRDQEIRTLRRDLHEKNEAIKELRNRLEQANSSLKLANARAQEEFQRGKSSRDPAFNEINRQLELHNQRLEKEKRLRLENREFWARRFAEIKAQMPDLPAQDASHDDPQ